MKFFKSRNRGQVGRGRQGYQECSVKSDTQLVLKRQRHEIDDVKGKCVEMRKSHVPDWKWGLGMTQEVVRKSEREGGSGAGWKRTLEVSCPNSVRTNCCSERADRGPRGESASARGPTGGRPGWPFHAPQARALCRDAASATSGPQGLPTSAARPRGRRRAPRPTCWLPPQPRPPRSSAHLTLEL